MKKTTVEKDEDEDDNDKNQCSVFVQGEEEEVGVHFGWMGVRMSLFIYLCNKKCTRGHSSHCFVCLSSRSYIDILCIYSNVLHLECGQGVERDAI